MIEFVTKYFPIVLDFVPLLGIFVSCFVAYKSFDKQKKRGVNEKRLEYVYFPLVSFLNQFESNKLIGAYELYWYMKDRIKDEKFITLLGSNKILTIYKELNDYFTDAAQNNLDDEEGIFKNFSSEIMKEFNKIKRQLGYPYQYNKVFMAFFWIFYIFLAMSAVLAVAYKCTENDLLLILFISIFCLTSCFLAVVLFYGWKIFRHETWPIIIYMFRRSKRSFFHRKVK